MEKLQENFDEIMRGIEIETLYDSWKIMETLSSKTGVIQNRCCWYYEGILVSFSEIISMKLGKNNKENKKLLKNMENTSYKL